MEPKTYKYTPDKYAVNPDPTVKPTTEETNQMLSQLNGREPDTTLENLYQKAINATGTDRLAILNQMASDPSLSDPITLDFWANELKKAGLCNVGTFKEAARNSFMGDDPPPGEPVLATNDRNEQEPGARPVIQINARHHREISEDAYQALLASNDPPRVFVRSGLLTRIKLDEKRRPIAEDISPEILKYELDRVANFITRRRGNGKDPIDTKATIQMAVVKDVMAYPHWPDLPPLGSIVQYPTFCPDGSLHAEPGYNPATQVYYYRNGLKLGDITPTVDNVTWAKTIINDHLLEGFPFADNASKTHAKAALLLPFVRHLVDGQTPLHMFDAPQQGTGKSLLCKAISFPTAPNGAALITPPDNDEEWRKAIVSMLLQTPSHVLIDNIPEKLQSGVLAAVLTANSYTARLLGTMKNVTVQNLPVWMGTGNNTTAHGELGRRTIWSRIDAKMEKPWERENFKHPDLEKWVKQNRGDIVTACLILINLWFKSGCPMGDKPLGSFESWAAIMGGILKVIDKDCDFLGNADDMYDKTNEDRAPWLAFVEQWWETYSCEDLMQNKETIPVGVSDLFEFASYHDPKKENDGNADDTEGMNLLGQFLLSHKEQARKVQLGVLLKKNADRVFGQYRIVDAGKKQRATQYKLVITQFPESESSESSESL